ncbi:MAG: hypothetical protein HC872_07420, partial [Gammaproteobacteria bacterium]|nr:hypothetical protein [Gammaproteobacteria bacterium]
QGRARWTSDWAQIEPLLEWQNNMGCVNACYNAALGKYLMCVTEGWPTCATMNSYILEADQLTGPWRMVVYLRNFGEQAYFLNFPTKFIAPDGLSMWLCYSGLFADNWNGNKIRERPPGSRYGMVLQQVRLLERG